MRRILRRSGERIQDLRLFWKLLLPLLLVILVMGASGSFLLVKFLSVRAQDTFDQDLFRRSVTAEVYLHDRALYLVDSVRLGSNFEGVAEAAGRRDVGRLRKLLAAVPAARPDLDLVVVTDKLGTGLVEIRREPAGLKRGEGGRWVARAFVAEVLQGLAGEGGDERSGFLEAAGRTVFATAGPIKRGKKIEGALIVGIGAERLAREAAERVDISVALYAPDGKVIAGAGGRRDLPAPPELPAGSPVRRRETRDGTAIASVYAPLRIRGQRLGTVAVAAPNDPAFASVAEARLRLTLLLLGAMAAVVGLGVALSRFILRRLRGLVEANRALARGDLSARAPLAGKDEFGELAHGFNLMAEQLQASYEELENRVEQRTEELRRLYQEVVKASEARQEFFAAISHEFRTPLFAILGHAEMMLDPGFRPDGRSWRTEFGKTIKGAAGDLLGRVNDILDLAKLESGRMDVETRELSLPAVIADLRGTITALARRSDLDARFHVPASLPMVHADPARLRQILLNLISNAVKYTPAGGRIDLTVAAADGRVDVSVSDTGVGIPKEAGEHVFEPFYQVAGTRAQRGQASTGLGLALTKRLVEAHGGEIWFTSEPKKGSTFTFSLRTAGAATLAGRTGRTRAKRAARAAR